MVSAESAAEVIVPCLWLDDSAEQAAAFYTQLLPAGRVLATSHYPESFDNPSGKPRGSVLTVEFEVAGQRFTALNGGPQFEVNPSISFFLNVESAEQATKVFEAFAKGGKVLMPLDAYPWSERYGWVQDRFGVSWQVIAGRREPGGAVIVPCLMFAGKVHGRAAEAIEAYTKLFPAGRVVKVEKYGPGEGPEGTVKHGRFMAGGHELVAMDSHLEHETSFGEGLSLQVMCKSQAEVDEYWESLSEGGEKGPCGWLKDRFGVSWQVVPHELSRWLQADDRRARDRVFEAMLKMKKLDLAALERAFAGGEPLSPR